MFEWLRKLFRGESKPVPTGVTEAPGVIVVSPFVPAASTAAVPSATPPPIPRVTRLKLDAADFLPITRAELLEAGRQQGRGWFVFATWISTLVTWITKSTPSRRMEKQRSVKLSSQLVGRS